MIASQRSSIWEYCLSSVSSCLSEKVPSTGEVQYRLARANTPMIAENRVHVITKAGDLSALLKERIVVAAAVVDELPPPSKISTAIVILYSLSSGSNVYVEDPFENTTGLDLSSMPARMRRTFFTWYSAIPSCAMVLSNSGSSSSFFLSKIETHTLSFED